MDIKDDIRLISGSHSTKIGFLHMSDLEDIMDNKTVISDYDLFVDQVNVTANNVGYNVTSMNVTQENCNLSSEKGHLWPYASFPILIVSLILGQLLRNIDSNLECIDTSFSLIAFLVSFE